MEHSKFTYNHNGNLRVQTIIADDLMAGQTTITKYDADVNVVNDQDATNKEDGPDEALFFKRPL